MEERKPRARSSHWQRRVKIAPSPRRLRKGRKNPGVLCQSRAGAAWVPRQQQGAPSRVFPAQSGSFGCKKKVSRGWRAEPQQPGLTTRPAGAGRKRYVRVQLRTRGYIGEPSEDGPHVLFAQRASEVLVSAGTQLWGCRTQSCNSPTAQTVEPSPTDFIPPQTHMVRSSPLR